MQPIRIAIVSDDRIFCDGLRRILVADSSVRAHALTEHLGLLPAVRVANPHIVLIDARILEALEICADLAGDGSLATILIAAGEDNEAFAIEALASGARGLLYKSAPTEDLSRAVHAVYQGEVWAPRHIIVAAWMRDISNGVSRRSPDVLRQQRLTNREIEVLRHAAAGLANKEVADALAIAEATVKTHLTRIFQKLGLRGRGRLAAAYHGITLQSSQPAPERHALSVRPLTPRTVGPTVRQKSYNP